MSSTIPLEYFTVKQTSLILGFSTNSIYKFLKEGRLKGARGSKKQGRFRITRTSIEDFLGAPLTDEFIQSKLHPNQPSPSTSPTNPAPTQPVKPTPQPDPTPSKPEPNPIPLHITRGLIIVTLIAIIADMLISSDFSIFQQLIRLSIVIILVLITYQFGDLPSRHQSPDHSLLKGNHQSSASSH